MVLIQNIIQYLFNTEVPTYYLPSCKQTCCVCSMYLYYKKIFQSYFEGNTNSNNEKTDSTNFKIQQNYYSKVISLNNLNTFKGTLKLSHVSTDIG